MIEIKLIWWFKVNNRSETLTFNLKKAYDKKVFSNQISNLAILKMKYFQLNAYTKT